MKKMIILTLFLSAPLAVVPAASTDTDSKPIKRVSFYDNSDRKDFDRRSEMLKRYTRQPKISAANLGRRIAALSKRRQQRLEINTAAREAKKMSWDEAYEDSLLTTPTPEDEALTILTELAFLEEAQLTFSHIEEKINKILKSLFFEQFVAHALVLLIKNKQLRAELHRANPAQKLEAINDQGVFFPSVIQIYLRNFLSHHENQERLKALTQVFVFNPDDDQTTPENNQATTEKHQ